MELKSQKLISAKNLQLIFPMNKDFEVHSLDPSSYHGSSFEHLSYCTGSSLFES